MKILINGCAGRMGLTLVRLIDADPTLELHGGLEGPTHADMGTDLGVLAGLPEIGSPVRADALELISGAGAVIDFSTPAATLEMAGLCAQARIIHIIGTTGFSAEDEAALAAAARHATLVKSGNMSLGVNLLGALVRQAAAALGDDWDIEILDMHHRHKVDAPSGTALLLGEEAARGRDVNLAETRDSGREDRTRAREAGDIGFAVLRGGSVVGHHDVVFAGDGENIVLGHRAETRDIFARGAIKAAQWAHGRGPGLFSMQDVLGLGDAPKS
jgi:4-hydroxy-tetrahydrodipicolinate reductase